MWGGGRGEQVPSQRPKKGFLATRGDSRGGEDLYPQTGRGHCPAPMSASWQTSQLGWQKGSHMRDLGHLSRVEKRVGSEVRGVWG